MTLGFYRNASATLSSFPRFIEINLFSTKGTVCLYLARTTFFLTLKECVGGQQIRKFNVTDSVHTQQQQRLKNTDRKAAAIA